MGSVHTLTKNSLFHQHTMLAIGIGITIAFAAPTVLELIKCAELYWDQTVYTVQNCQFQTPK